MYHKSFILYRYKIATSSAKNTNGACYNYTLRAFHERCMQVFIEIRKNYTFNWKTILWNRIIMLVNDSTCDTSFMILN
jgi:hypothetical protein